MRVKQQLAILFAMLMVWYPTSGMSGSSAPLGTVIPKGVANLNGTALSLETTVFSGDIVATTPEGLAVVLLPKGDQIHVGPQSEVRVTKSEGSVLAVLTSGALLARSGFGQTISVRARGLIINPQSRGRYEVALAGNTVVVAANEGAVTVQGTNQNYTVPAGKAVRFEMAAGPQGPAGAGAGAGFGPAAAAWIGVAAAAGSFVAGWLIAREVAKDACRDAVRAVSPSAPTTGC